MAVVPWLTRRQATGTLQVVLGLMHKNPRSIQQPSVRLVGVSWKRFLAVVSGEDGKPAYVWGDVLVDLNGTTSSGTTGTPIADDAKGCVVGQIFGCNNVNGTPKGDVMVHIYATQNAEADKIANTPATGTEGEEGYKPADETQKVKGRYDITAVYGGGNMAAYEPADPDNNKSEVIIDGCQLTSIKACLWRRQCRLHAFN